MTNAPETRKTHVIRILGTNKAGDILTDIWADVERFDIFKTISSDENFQGIQHKLRWMDDPDNQDEYNPDGNPSRKTKIVKVCDPSSDDLNDPDEWIPIPAIVHIKVVNSANNFQGVQDKFINEDVQQSRIVEKRRILHYDTNIDDKAEAAFDADPMRKVYVVPGKDYTRDDETKDEDQYVEHEIIKYTKQIGGNSTTSNMPAVDAQGKQTKYQNKYLIDESAEAKLEELGENDFNPPYRLDPFQNIINVNLGGAAKFGDKADGPEKP